MAWKNLFRKLTLGAEAYAELETAMFKRRTTELAGRKGMRRMYSGPKGGRFLDSQEMSFNFPDTDRVLCKMP